MREALNKGEVASKDSQNEQSVVHFTDEKGRTLSPVTPEQVTVLRQSEPVDMTPYIINMTQNQGLAAPVPMSDKQLER